MGPNGLQIPSSAFVVGDVCLASEDGGSLGWDGGASSSLSDPSDPFHMCLDGPDWSLFDSPSPLLHDVVLGSAASVELPELPHAASTSSFGKQKTANKSKRSKSLAAPYPTDKDTHKKPKKAKKGPQWMQTPVVAPQPAKPTACQLSLSLVARAGKTFPLVAGHPMVQLRRDHGNKVDGKQAPRQRYLTLQVKSTDDTALAGTTLSQLSWQLFVLDPLTGHQSQSEKVAAQLVRRRAEKTVKVNVTTAIHPAKFARQDIHWFLLTAQSPDGATVAQLQFSITWRIQKGAYKPKHRGNE